MAPLQREKAKRAKNATRFKVRLGRICKRPDAFVARPCADLFGGCCPHSKDAFLRSERRNIRQESELGGAASCGSVVLFEEANRRLYHACSACGSQLGVRVPPAREDNTLTELRVLCRRVFALHKRDCKERRKKRRVPAMTDAELRRITGTTLSGGELAEESTDDEEEDSN